MPLRLMELFLPQTDNQNLREIITEESDISFWHEETSETGLLVKMLLSVEQTEPILDRLEEKFAGVDGFRVVLLSVEATIPRIEEIKEESPTSAESQPADDTDKNVDRISREELYTDIADGMKFTRVFVAMVILSAIVAAVGLLRDNVAVIIGAMVIAPLLGPNVGLALATTLGDFELGRRALKTNLAGIVIALGLSIVFGVIFHVDPTMPEISSRTKVELLDIVLALASGTAGVLAFTSGISTALIGVMVAVALLPPLVTLGLLIGSGNSPDAFGAFLLVVTNLISINLAGVTTFLIQGIRPRRWWEASQAEKATRLAIVLWSVLLLILVIVIILSQ